MPKTTREEIEKNTIGVMEQVRFNRNIVNEIIESIGEFNYLSGDVQGYISNTENEISELDPRTICLLLECTYKVTKIPKAQPLLYFTEQEMKTSRQLTGDLLRKDRVELPITLYDVHEMSRGMYFTEMSASEINNWLNSLILNYNKDTQREPTVNTFDGQIIFEPTIYYENVQEMSELLRIGKLVRTDAIVFNAGVKTSESKFGEYIYNRESKTLQITKGTKLDIVDGYHACMAIQDVMTLNENINHKFIVVFTNFTVKECHELLEQKSKATPLSPTRIEQFSDDFINEVIDRLEKDSELQGRIIDSGIRKYDDRFLVAHDILADGIKDNFKIENKSQVIDISEFLCDFFDYLILSFESEFINNVSEIREKSFINHDFMFYGFITLAKRMESEGIKIRKIRSILSEINFNKDNQKWNEVKLIDKNGEVVELDKAKKIITKFFKEIDLKEGVLSE